jgi:hypothetical protein
VYIQCVDFDALNMNIKTKIKPSNQHLFNLIHDVDLQVKMTWLSEGFRSLNVQKYLYQWAARNDVDALDAFGQSMIDSFRLAATRGLSGYPEDTERSMRSLLVNIQYYRVRVEARLKPAFHQGVARCADPLSEPSAPHPAGFPAGVHGSLGTLETVA